MSYVVQYQGLKHQEITSQPVLLHREDSDSANLQTTASSHAIIVTRRIKGRLNNSIVRTSYGPDPRAKDHDNTDVQTKLSRGAGSSPPGVKCAHLQTTKRLDARDIGAIST